MEYTRQARRRYRLEQPTKQLLLRIAIMSASTLRKDDT